ncbi:MFS transporter permease [Streptomyces sp. WM4235]|uniref:MFS transporter n=1 Tax=Streptomyces sp. WM4235 TaxID=1415551 RepID=UPI0006ADEA14|nr:MFS transporter [Streptomyces sp. WM4235]KOU64302.1 MFS transporter permease [Streptomyces sp. WM4235]
MTAKFESPLTVTAASAERASAQGPTEPVTRGWTTLFGLIWFGHWMANLVPLQLLLPMQMEAIDPASKVRDFAIVNGISGVVALIALPLCGALCDRSRNRFGRRRLSIVAGALTFAAGLVVTGRQTTVTGVSVAWSASLLGLSAATAGLTAVIADRVPERQRGNISSAIYGPQALGVVAGIAIISSFGLAPATGYIVLAALLIACTVPFLVVHRDAGYGAEPRLRLSTLIVSMASSLKNREFAWAFGGRLLVNLANSLGTCYMLYFLTDHLKVSDPETSLLTATGVYVLAGVLATTVAGVLSDRLGRRRIFVASAAILQAVSGFLLAGSPAMSTTLIASALMGGGFGAYMAVDQALITQVLPDAENRAKDLGIMNIGSVVPPTLAPLIASFIITEEGGGYPLLFTTVGAMAVVGAALVYRIRSVR